jgi:RNA polymerase sigma-70 factor (ECF subfamily)
MAEVSPDTAETRSLLEKVRDGDRQALDGLLTRHRAALLDFVELHLDPGIRGRVDPSDVVQETHMAVAQRIDDYLARRPMPFHLWLRKTAHDRMLNLRRDHRRRRRSVAREEVLPDRSSLLLVRPLLAGGPSPSARLADRELAERVRDVMGQLSESDRDILLLRHAENLPYGEVAVLLDIDEASARKRYGRALIRLQKILKDLGLLE